MFRHHYIEKFHSNFKQEIFAIIFFIALLVVLRFEAVIKINTHYLGGRTADAGLYIWLFESNLKNLFELPWFNTGGFYPYTKTLAWSDNFILPSIIALPFVNIGLSNIIAYNLILFLSLFLNGFLTYRLGFLLSGNFWGSLLAGTCFLVFPFLTMHLGHPQLQFAFWLPLSLIFFFNYYNSQQSKYAFLLGFAVFLSYLTTVYYTIFILILLEVLVLGLLLQKPRYYKINFYIKLILFFCIGFIPIIPFVLPYLAVKETFGTRAIGESLSFSANFLSYFSSTNLNNLYGNVLNASKNNEAQFFCGFLLKIFLLIGFFRVFGNKKFINEASVFVIVFACASILSFQNFSSSNTWTALCMWLSFLIFIYLIFKLGKLERQLKYNYITNRGLIALFLLAAFYFYFISFGTLANSDQENGFGLYTFYYDIFPGASALRAISRAGIFVIFFLCLIIPFTFNFLKKNGFLPFGIVPLLFMVVYLENYSSLYPLEPKLDTPPVYQYLKTRQSKNGVVISLPFTREVKKNGTVKSWSIFAKLNMDYLNHLQFSEMKSVNGYSGQRSMIMNHFPSDLKNFPDFDSVNALSKISNLRYIIYNEQNSLFFNKVNFFKDIENFGNSLTHLLSDADGNHLFEFHPVTKITNDYFLMVPSYPKEQKLNLQFSVQNNETENVALEIFVKKYYETSPYAVINLENSKKPKNYQIILPNTPDTVRPIFLNFKVQGKADIYLKDRFVE